jgi:hypothetical protein
MARDLFMTKYLLKTQESKQLSKGFAVGFKIEFFLVTIEYRTSSGRFGLRTGLPFLLCEVLFGLELAILMS